MARHPQSMPEPKSEKTVKFVNDTGQVLEVISTIGKAELAILKRRGYTQASKIKPPNKDVELEEKDDDEDEDDDDEESTETPVRTPTKAPPRKAPSR